STTVGKGTPGYAPLEQADYRDGKGFPVTMDIYALGGTMFKMLTGHRAPEASYILNDGFPEEELSETNAPSWLSTLVEKCMSPMRKSRYQTVDEVLQALQQTIVSDDDITIIDSTIQKAGVYGYYKKCVGDREYGTFQMKRIPVTDPLPFPEEIKITYKPNDGKGISYDISMHAKETRRVEIYKDGLKVFSVNCLIGIPDKVHDYLVNEGFLSKVHWEYEESTLPLDIDSSIYLEVAFSYSDGTSFVRNLQNAHKDWYHLFLDSVKGLLDVLTKSSIIPDKGTINKLHRDFYVSRPLVIAPETNRIDIEFFTRFYIGKHRKDGSYEISITPNEISGFYLDFNSDQGYISEKKPITSSRFSVILSDIQKIGIQIRQKGKEYNGHNSDYEPEKFRIVLYTSKGRYAIHGQTDLDYGDIVGDVIKYNHKIAVALPELRKCFREQLKELIPLEFRFDHKIEIRYFPMSPDSIGGYILTISENEITGKIFPNDRRVLRMKNKISWQKHNDLMEVIRKLPISIRQDEKPYFEITGSELSFEIWIYNDYGIYTKHWYKRGCGDIVGDISLCNNIILDALPEVKACFFADMSNPENT
ncbi:MAG: hypothetical protein LUC91_07100, partial [Prevotella sp.]|nr:hypothetical protein [Prevotella sp.]